MARLAARLAKALIGGHPPGARHMRHQAVEDLTTLQIFVEA
jgi:hypothetical protein